MLIGQLICMWDILPLNSSHQDRVQQFTESSQETPLDQSFTLQFLNCIFELVYIELIPSCPHPKHFYYLHIFFTYSFFFFRQVIHWNKSTKHLEHKLSSQSSPLYVAITYYNLQPIHFTCFILFYSYVTNMPNRF